MPVSPSRGSYRKSRKDVSWPTSILEALHAGFGRPFAAGDHEMWIVRGSPGLPPAAVPAVLQSHGIFQYNNTICQGKFYILSAFSIKHSGKIWKLCCKSISSTSRVRELPKGYGACVDRCWNREVACGARRVVVPQEHKVGLATPVWIDLYDVREPVRFCADSVNVHRQRVPQLSTAATHRREAGSLALPRGERVVGGFEQRISVAAVDCNELVLACHWVLPCGARAGSPQTTFPLRRSLRLPHCLYSQVMSDVSVEITWVRLLVVQLCT